MINLLPSVKKEKIYGELFKKQIYSLGILILTVLAGCSIFILNMMVFLKIQARELKQSLNMEAFDAETQKANALEGVIKDLNVRVSRYVEFRSGQVSMLDVFSRIQEVMPAGVRLTAMVADAADGKIILSGRAQSRDDVVMMTSRLKNSAFFERVESPLANFLEKENANFSFIFYLALK